MSRWCELAAERCVTQADLHGSHWDKDDVPGCLRSPAVVTDFTELASVFGRLWKGTQGLKVKFPVVLFSSFLAY